MLQSLEIPQDDAIGPALVELDEKLSVWVSAMTAAQESLRQFAAQVEERETSLNASWEAAPAAQVAATDSPAAQGATHDDITEQETSADGAELHADESLSVTASSVEEVPDERKPEAPKPAAPKPPAVRSATKGIVVPNQESPSPEPERCEVESKASSEDEDLLATLDEKTVKVLRVMRRLSPVKKSMQELLAEFQNQQGSEPDDPAPARTSWWKRK